MYKLWINKKGRDATHWKLINALKSDYVGETNVGQKYEEWLKQRLAYALIKEDLARHKPLPDIDFEILHPSIHYRYCLPSQ